VKTALDPTPFHHPHSLLEFPKAPVRVHQHLKIGDGDVNWDEFFGGLKEVAFLDQENTVMVSSVFAEDGKAEEVSRYQLETMKQYVQKVSL
jgi:myo-inositol catabolism protein IolH